MCGVIVINFHMHDSIYLTGVLIKRLTMSTSSWLNLCRLSNEAFNGVRLSKVYISQTFLFIKSHKRERYCSNKSPNRLWQLCCWYYDWKSCNIKSMACTDCTCHAFFISGGLLAFQYPNKLCYQNIHLLKTNSHSQMLPLSLFWSQLLPRLK